MDGKITTFYENRKAKNRSGPIATKQNYRG